jgi:ABC-type uncharacterized transport system permease subunit
MVLFKRTVTAIPITNPIIKIRKILLFRPSKKLFSIPVQLLLGKVEFAQK